MLALPARTLTIRDAIAGMLGYSRYANWVYEFAPDRDPPPIAELYDTPINTDDATNVKLDALFIEQLKAKYPDKTTMSLMRHGLALALGFPNYLLAYRHGATKDNHD